MTIIEQCKQLYAGCPEPTWIDQAKWVLVNHPQEVIYDTCLRLYFALDDIPEEGPAKDDIREEATIFWYALDEAHNKKLEQHLARRDT
jgi:hypothetical protein